MHLAEPVRRGSAPARASGPGRAGEWTRSLAGDTRTRPRAAQSPRALPALRVPTPPRPRPNPPRPLAPSPRAPPFAPAPEVRVHQRRRGRVLGTRTKCSLGIFHGSGLGEKIPRTNATGSTVTRSHKKFFREARQLALRSQRLDWGHRIGLVSPESCHRGSLFEKTHTCCSLFYWGHGGASLATLSRSTQRPNFCTKVTVTPVSGRQSSVSSRKGGTQERARRSRRHRRQPPRPRPSTVGYGTATD